MVMSLRGSGLAVVAALLVACGGGGGDGGGDGDSRGGDDEKVSPDAPVIASFTASVQRVNETGRVTFSAVVNDPQGPEDVAAGKVLDLSGVSYGSLRKV